MTTSFEDFVRMLPKVELHVHLEGSMTPELAFRLAARHGLVLPFGVDPDADAPAFVFESFDAFIRLYVALSRCLQTADDVRDVVIDLARRFAEQNVRYAEVTFTPLTHLVRGVDPDELMAGLEEGRAEAETEFGVGLCWVFDVVRSFPDQAEPTLAFALDMQARDPGSVIGLGVGGPEAGDFHIDAIADMFERARSAGLKSLPHAGEMAGPESVWIAVSEFGADRIGHGIRCLEDPELVDHLRRKAIPLEVCPTSNVRLGVVPRLEDHPLPRLLDAGLTVSLASDDPGLFRTHLVEETLRCAAAFGWRPQQVRRLMAAAVEHAFLPSELAAELRADQDDVPDPTT